MGYNGGGLEGWAGFKKVERRKKRIPGGRNIRKDYIDPGQEVHWGHLVTGMALRILCTSCGSKVRATSETHDGRALRNRQGTRNRGPGCDNVLQN